MRFYVDSLHDLPVTRARYFVHVIDLAQVLPPGWVEDTLSSPESLFGIQTGLVSGPFALSEEVGEFHSGSTWPPLPGLRELLDSTVCLLVSEGDARTGKPIYLIPVSTREDGDSSRELTAILINLVASALRAHTLDSLVAFFGAQELRLDCAENRFLLCTFRHPDKLYELMPSVMDSCCTLKARIGQCVAV